MSVNNQNKEINAEKVANVSNKFCIVRIQQLYKEIFEIRL